MSAARRNWVALISAGWMMGQASCGAFTNKRLEVEEQRMSPSHRLVELGLRLPPVTKPVGSYVPAIRTGNLIFVSGQIPFEAGKLTCTGKVGRDVALEQAA